MIKEVLLPAVFIALLPLQYALAEENNAGDFIRFLNEFGTEEKAKEKICQIVSINGHTFANHTRTARKNGTFDRNHLEYLMGLPDMSSDSLEYELFSNGISQASEGASGAEIEQSIMNSCMSHSPEEVRNMSDSPSQRAKNIELHEQWENAGCDEKMDQLAKASAALEDGETDIDGYLKAVDDKILRLEMRAAASKSLDLFAIYVDQFELECGLSREEIEKARESEPDANCVHTVAQLDDLYYDFQDTGNLNRAKQALTSLITQTNIRQTLLQSLEADENFQMEVTKIFDDRCQSL